VTRKGIQSLWVALAVLALLAACAPPAGPTPDVTERHPFRVDIGGEDGAKVSWEGYTKGYLPGSNETFHLAVQNNTKGPWEGRVCMQLLEPAPSQVVMLLAEQDFDLEPGGGFARDVTVDLPAELTPGTYGLSLVVHQPTGPVVDVIPVWVGEGEPEPFQGEWPTRAALEMCSPPAGNDEGSAKEPVVFREDFEQALDGWEKGSDVPEDPARPGHPVAWSIEVQPEQASTGRSSARFTIDGKQDDGTIWLMRRFDVAPDTALDVRLTFDFWSESQSFNTQALI